MPGPHIAGPTGGILAGRELRMICCHPLAMQLKQPTQEGSAPTTTSAGAKTIGELTRPGGFLDAEIVDHFPLSDVKAKAELVVQFHSRLQVNHHSMSGLRPRILGSNSLRLLPAVQPGRLGINLSDL